MTSIFSSIPSDVLIEDLLCFLNLCDLNSLGLVSRHCLSITKKRKNRYRAAWKIYRFWRLHRWKRINWYGDLYTSTRKYEQGFPIRVMYIENCSWKVITGFIVSCGYFGNGGNTFVYSKDKSIHIYTIWSQQLLRQPQYHSVEIPKRYFQDEELWLQRFE